MALLIAARLLVLLPLLRAEQAPAVDIEQDDSAMMQSRQLPKKVDRKAWVKKARSAQVKAFDDELGIDPPPLPNSGEDDALGLLCITYGWPTQPGDINDKRSFCTVDENYNCTDGFSLVPAEVKGLEFMVAQQSIYNSSIEESFTKAIRALLADKRVRAITANCGFITNYAQQIQEITAKLVSEEGLDPKPMVLGSLAVAPLLTNQTGEGDGEVQGWGLLAPDERAVVVTANSATLTKNFYQLMNAQGFADPTLEDVLGKKMKPEVIQKIKIFMNKKFGIEMDDDAKLVDQVTSWLIMASESHGFQGGVNFLKNSGKSFRSFGAQDVKGFGDPLKYGTEHNVTLAGPYMTQWVLDTLFRIEYSRKNLGAVKGKFFIFECTELPAYANGVRMATRLPVWDITTVGQCLMAASPSYDPSVHIFKNADFKACMLSWTNPYRFDERFGKQTDYTIVGYGDGKDPGRALEDFDWGKFGKPEGARCTKEVGCV